MIDLHSHILSGIDDGARTITDSLDLINQSIDCGVKKIVATPHIHIGTFDNNLASITQAFNSLSEQVVQANLNIELAFAAEIRICPEIMMLAQTRELPFLGRYNGKDVLLLEFPHSHILPGSDKLVAWLLAHNICPMIPHPERNRELWQHPYLINEFANHGCLLQITAGSLLGDFGEKSQCLAWQLLESEHVYTVASDMHSLKRRPNRMSAAFAAIAAKFGESHATQLCITNPDAIFLTNQSARTFKGIS